MAAAKKTMMRYVVAVFTCFWLLVFLPSEQTAYTMVGAYAAQKVVEDPKVQQLSAKVLKIVEMKLDSYIAIPAK